MTDTHLLANIAQYAVIIKDKKVLMLWPPKGPLWVYPGGRMNEDDKDIEVALKREIKEELSADIEILEPADVQMWAIEGKSLRYAVFFVCKLKGDISKIKLSDEHEKFSFMSYDELMKHYSEYKDRAKPGIRVADKLKAKGFI